MAAEQPDATTRNIKTEFDSWTTDQIRMHSIAQSFPYSILAFNIQGNLNIGNMLRSAHLCGCRKMVLFGRRKYDKRSAVGVYNYLEVERVQGLKNPQQDLTTELTDLDFVFDNEVFVKFIIENNYVPIYVEQSSDSIPAIPANISKILDSIPNNKIPIFIFGNEGTGIPANIMETRSRFDESFVLELHQSGALQSYNVSNACAIVAYLVSLYFMYKQ
jgi:tRNA G18 (ribose-2'-O)-methylase SpoU